MKGALANSRVKDLLSLQTSNSSWSLNNQYLRRNPSVKVVSIVVIWLKISILHECAFEVKRVYRDCVLKMYLDFIWYDTNTYIHIIHFIHRLLDKKAFHGGLKSNQLSWTIAWILFYGPGLIVWIHNLCVKLLQNIKQKVHRVRLIL